MTAGLLCTQGERREPSRVPGEGAASAASALPADERLVFVLGRGRSGTSLLARMLDAHPAVAVAPEALFVLHLRGHYGGAEIAKPQVPRLVRDLWREERLRRYRLAPGAVEERLGELAPAPLRRLCAEVYALEAAARGKPAGVLLGDKNPLHALFARQLAELFPRARFVHLVRDYRDNVASFRAVPFDLRSPAGLAYRWRRYNEAVLGAAERFPGRFLRLRFEDLVRAPEATLSAVCRFLSIPFDEAMVAARRRPEHLQGLAWHAALDGAVDPAKAQRWRAALPAQAVAVADAICQPLGESLGYPPAAAGGRLPVRVAAAAAPGLALGWSMTALELLLFRLPLAPRAALVRGYRRRLTGNRIQ